MSVTFKTVQANAFKTIFEVLKDILNDVNIYFDKNGIRILTLDTARSALINIQLDSNNFEEYTFDSTTPLVAGLNITNTFKLLKSVTNNDTLEIQMNNTDIMNIKIENTSKHTKTQFQLKLLDIDDDHIQLPVVDTTIITSMPSIDLQRICRDMTNVATDVTFTRNKDEFIIKCEGDFALQKTTIEYKNDDSNFKGLLSGVYSLKYINLFTKATTMCSTVQIIQEDQNRFMVMKYNVANLGIMKFYLATKIDED